MNFRNVANDGTPYAFTQGDMLYGGATGNLTVLPIGPDGTVLTSDTGVITWSGSTRVLATPNFMSATGLTGTDNTAEIITSVTLPANTLQTIGDYVEYTAFFEATT